MKMPLLFIAIITMSLQSFAQDSTYSTTPIDSMQGEVLINAFNTQENRFTIAQRDSIVQRTKRKMIGGVLFAAGGTAALVAGIIELKKANDYINSLNGVLSGEGLFGHYEIKKSEQYAPGIVLMVAGATFTTIGVLKLVKASKMKKAFRNTDFSFAPSFVPYTSGLGKMSSIPQTSVLVKIPLGR